MEFWLLGNYMLFNNKLSLAISWDMDHNTTKDEIARFWDREWVERTFRFTDTLHALKLTLEEIVLLRVIILTFTGRRIPHYTSIT